VIKLERLSGGIAKKRGFARDTHFDSFSLPTLLWEDEMQ
jgi:hypothetical protein